MLVLVLLIVGCRPRSAKDFGKGTVESVAEDFVREELGEAVTFPVPAVGVLYLEENEWYVRGTVREDSVREYRLSMIYKEGSPGKMNSWRLHSLHFD